MIFLMDKMGHFIILLTVWKTGGRASGMPHDGHATEIVICVGVSDRNSFENYWPIFAFRVILQYQVYSERRTTMRTWNKVNMRAFFSKSFHIIGSRNIFQSDNSASLHNFVKVNENNNMSFILPEECAYHSLKKKKVFLGDGGGGGVLLVGILILV